MSAPSSAALDTLPVSEVFGPTLQGEGPAAGRAAVFVRFMGCNLSCAWCDTPWTWDATRFDLRAETAHRTAAAIAADVEARPGKIVVLTGGEPLLNQDRPAFRELLLDLAQTRSVHIETNGTIAPARIVQQCAEAVTVSPKLPNAGEHRGHQDPVMAAEWPALAAAWPWLSLKVVCRDVDDVDRAVQLAERTGWPREQVWVMPEGTTAAALAGRWPAIAEAAAGHGINATHRLHVLAWGDERGR